MLSRNVGKAIEDKTRDWVLISSDVRDYLKTHDFVVGNLECPITEYTSPKDGKGFKANPISLEHLSEFNLLTLANNHIFDCGNEGALETLKIIKENGYHTSGLRKNKNKRSLFIIEIKNQKIGFIAAAVDSCIKNENFNMPWIEKAEHAVFLEQVKESAKYVDHLFILIHGGNEMISYPEPSFRVLCKKIIDAGASSVITHHPHVLGGSEIYNGKPIIYSLGDFIFDGQSYKRRRGAILSLRIINDKIDFEIHPTQITDNLTVEVADPKTVNKILKKWITVSRKLKGSNYNKKYKSVYVREMLSFQSDRIRFIFNNEGAVSTIKFILRKFNLIGLYSSRIIQGKIK